jgi:hypothetical protein
MLARLQIRTSADAASEVQNTLTDIQDAGPSDHAVRRKPIRSTYDTTNAVVAVDGVITTLPASSDQFDPRAIELPAGRDVKIITETLERRKSVRSERRKAGFMKCLREDVVPMGKLPINNRFAYFSHLASRR